MNGDNGERSRPQRGRLTLLWKVLVVYGCLAASFGLLASAKVLTHSNAVSRNIVDNRIQATIDSCAGRNVERKIQRAQLQSQVQQTEKVPARAFEQFNVTKEESLRRLHSWRADLTPLDCRHNRALEQLRRARP